MRARPAAPVAATGAVILVVLGPLFVRSGFALRGDMVFTPDQPWKPAWLGLDGSVPRAVPMDALVSLADEVLPGAILQRLLLVAAFAAGGLGIARLARRYGRAGQVAAVVVYLWNPWVHERLAIGQWATVLGYGLLPWLVLAAVAARDGRRGGWPATYLLLLAAAVCAPSVGLVAALVAVAMVVPGRRPSRVGTTLALAVLANLPWIVPAALGPHLHASRAQFADFAARGESALGALASLVSMGGIWKTSVVPPERLHAVVVAVAGLLALAFIAGFRYAVPALGRRTATGIGIAAVASFVLAWLPTWGPAGRALGALSTGLPALGILRDSHRYLAPLGLLLALGAGALVDHLVAGDRVPSGRALAAILLLAPVLLLPSLVWGLAGLLRPVQYPEDWTTVARAVAKAPGATVVLPWTGSYRGYAWNHRRAVLDPAPRFLPGDVLVDDRVFLHTGVLAGEDPFLARVGRALAGPDPGRELSGLGVRWILVEKGNGVHAADIPAGTTVFDGRWLTLVDLGPATGDLGHWRPNPPRWIVVVADVATLSAACVSVGSLLHRSRRTGR